MRRVESSHDGMSHRSTSPYFILSPMFLTAPPLLGSAFNELEKKTFEVLSDTMFWSSAVTPCGLQTGAKPQGTV
jgi:hypothetical protein